MFKKYFLIYFLLLSTTIGANPVALIWGAIELYHLASWGYDSLQEYLIKGGKFDIEKFNNDEQCFKFHNCLNDKQKEFFEGDYQKLSKQKVKITLQNNNVTKTLYIDKQEFKGFPLQYLSENPILQSNKDTVPDFNIPPNEKISEIKNKCDQGNQKACEESNKIKIKKILEKIWDHPIELVKQLKKENSYGFFAQDQLVIATLRRGKYFYQHRDLKSAFEDFRESCSNQNLEACVNLAYMLEKGKGVEKKLETAFKYYIGACENGNGIACNNAGLLILNSSEIQEDENNNFLYPDTDEALELFDESCAMGNLAGCQNFAWLNERLFILSFDLRRLNDAIQSYERACDLFIPSKSEKEHKITHPSCVKKNELEKFIDSLQKKINEEIEKKLDQ